MFRTGIYEDAFDVIFKKYQPMDLKQQWYQDGQDGGQDKFKNDSQNHTIRAQ